MGVGLPEGLAPQRAGKQQCGSRPQECGGADPHCARQRGVASAGPLGIEGGAECVSFEMQLSLSPATPSWPSRRAAGGESTADANVDELLEALSTKLLAAAYSVGGADVPRLARRLDRNRSGSIELDDWARAVRRYLGAGFHQASEAETLAMFEAVDTDGDGLITEEELAEFLGERVDGVPTQAASGTEDVEATVQLESQVAALAAQLQTTRRKSEELGHRLAVQVSQGSSPRDGSNSPAVAERRRKLAKRSQLIQLRRQRIEFAERQLHEQVRAELAHSKSDSPVRKQVHSAFPEDADQYRPAVSSPRVVTYADKPVSTAATPERSERAAREVTATSATTNSNTTSPSLKTRADEPLSRFEQFDLDGDGMLNKAELQKMCSFLHYDVDASYLDGVMQSFGSQSGLGITKDEFEAVWKFFGGDVEEGVPEESVPREALVGSTDDPLLKRFQAYDLNKSGSLSLFEVQQLLKDIGHQLDIVKPAIFKSGLPVQQMHSYVNSIFGDFDEDANGSIGFMEFRKLWEHLG